MPIYVGECFESLKWGEKEEEWEGDQRGSREGQREGERGKENRSWLAGLMIKESRRVP